MLLVSMLAFRLPRSFESLHLGHFTHSYLSYSGQKFIHDKNIFCLFYGFNKKDVQVCYFEGIFV